MFLAHDNNIMAACYD